MLRDIWVVDVVDGSLLSRPQDVLIIDDKISSITDSGTLTPPADIMQIDGHQKYLIPGLWDMHAHPDDPELWRMNPVVEHRDLLMPQFVIHGVTGIRDMAGSLAEAHRWEKLGADDQLLTPRIVACGPLLDGPNPMWDGSLGLADQSRIKPSVDSLMNAGADFLKVYSLLPRDLFFTLSRYAVQQQIPMVGHVPTEVLPSEAAVSGMKSQEHLLEILKECSSRSQQLKAGLITFEQPTGLERYIARQRFLLDTFDEEQWEQLIQVFVEQDTWHTPTLSMWYKNAWFESELVKDRPLYDYLPPYIQTYWTTEHNDHLKYRENESFISLKQDLYRFYEKLTLDLHRAGVRIMAGTDTGANPLCWPGNGVHNELEALVNAGLLPAEALKTATINPALFLGIEAELGTVEVGKVADVVILDSNPLVNISAISQVWGVIKAGKFIGPKERQQILNQIKEVFEKS